MPSLNAILTASSRGVKFGTIQASNKDAFLFTVGMLIGQSDPNAEYATLLEKGLDLPEFVKTGRKITSLSVPTKRKTSQKRAAKAEETSNKAKESQKTSEPERKAVDVPSKPATKKRGKRGNTIKRDGK